LATLLTMNRLLFLVVLLPVFPLIVLISHLHQSNNRRGGGGGGGVVCSNDADETDTTTGEITLEFRDASDMKSEERWDMARDCSKGLCRRTKYANDVKVFSKLNQGFYLDCADIEHLMNNADTRRTSRAPLRTNENVTHESWLVQQDLEDGKSTNLTSLIYKKSNSYESYLTMLKEITIRQDESFPYFTRLHGSCYDNSTAHILTAQSDGYEPLCDDGETDDEPFEDSPCARLLKIRKKLTSSGERSRTMNSLMFLENFICFVSTLERKNLFLEDFHGSNFLVSSDYEIKLNYTNKLIFHGSENIYANTVCVRQDQCAKPTGDGWNENSANKFFYDQFFEGSYSCVNNKCIGFNASLHMSAISRWIIPALVDNFRVKWIASKIMKIRWDIGEKIGKHKVIRSQEFCDRARELRIKAQRWAETGKFD